LASIRVFFFLRQRCRRFAACFIRSVTNLYDQAVPSLTKRIPFCVRLLIQNCRLETFFMIFGTVVASLLNMIAATYKPIEVSTRRAQTVLLQHPWPGNVRELENVISAACITAMGDFIDLSDLPEQLQHRNPRLPGDEDWQPLSLDEVRKVHIQKVLQMCNGNRLRAAQILGIGRTSLYRYLKRDGCETPMRTQTSGAAA
jgi:hypothetical protein